ncbi:phytanoyl-CoA dioxygenase family protein [Xanthobacter pseudotagetidis]|uniref:phytanoyl-CoA dioxygenase n=1 Tax=Xanthobacter pseudotagetidis TaxID=3119911 RepID=UPI003728785D
MGNLSSGLSAAQIEHFIDQGYVRLDGAFDAALARQGREALWAQIGLTPDAPEGWTRPVVRVGFMAGAPFAAAANTKRLHIAYDALAGAGRWVKPSGLGSFAIRFPSPDDPGDTGWHVDMSFGTESPDFMQWRANILSCGRALLMLFLFSDVGLDDAPTRLRAGSHAHIARQLLPWGEEGLSLAELAADGFASSAHCPEALATGAAGTVYLCHPFLVHAAQPHRGTRPRLLAQPALLPAGSFDPALAASPVQRAIRGACGLG